MVLSDLTFSLIALGGVFMAGLSIHSVWQARKAAPRRADSNPEVHLEPGLHMPEPPVSQAPIMLDPGAAAAVSAQSVVDSSSSTAAEGVSDDAETAPAAIKPARYVARIDGLLDAVVPIGLEAPLSGEGLLAHIPVTRRAGTKPFLVEACHESTRQWEHPVAGSRYTELQVGIQLANRHGALNEIEYSEFVQKIEGLAQAVGGMADFPDMLDVVSRARELDAFAGQHDAQLAIHLRARDIAWSVGYIQQSAARQGFVGLMSGRMALPSAEEGAPPILSLQFDAQAAMADDPNQAALRSVTVHFDVPQTDLEAKPFLQWQQCARTLAESMDAHVVDDSGRLLNEEGFAAIDKALERLYKALDERGVSAGSMPARRLFS
jgi:hypothetical protein